MTSNDGMMFFVKTSDLRVLVVGSGKIARRKIFKLSKAGADVVVVSKEKPRFTAAGVKFEVEDGLEYAKKNINNFDIVVAATDDKKLNSAVAELALKKRKLINVVTDPDKCNIFFPAVADFKNLQIGITTRGKSPLMAKMIKKKILKAIQKEDLEQIAFAIRVREILKKTDFSAEEIKEFLKSISKEATVNMSDHEILMRAKNFRAKQI